MCKTFIVRCVSQHDCCTREFLTKFRAVVEETNGDHGAYERTKYTTPLKTLDDLWDLIGEDSFRIEI